MKEQWYSGWSLTRIHGFSYLLWLGCKRLKWIGDGTKTKADLHSPHQSAFSAVDCHNPEIEKFLSLCGNATVCRRRMQKMWMSLTPNRCPKVFLLKSEILQKAQRVAKYLLQWTFKNRPIWSGGFCNWSGFVFTQCTAACHSDTWSWSPGYMAFFIVVAWHCDQVSCSRFRNHFLVQLFIFVVLIKFFFI